MAGKFKKSTSYFDVAAEKAEERQQKIVESASESQKPAPQVRSRAPQKGAEGASERLVQLSVYVPESYRKRLKQAALEEDKSVSDIARELFDEYLAENGF